MFTGTPPLAFTYGLGAELVFPLRVGAATAVLTGPTPDHLREGITRFGATRVFTAPTAYRALLAQADDDAFRSVRSFVSAGEHLPRPTFDAWQAATGHRIIDGIGATEMIHIFISAAGTDIRPGSTGRAVPGYHACVLDENDRPAAPGTIGPARGARPDRVSLSRRRAAAGATSGTAGTSPVTPSSSTRTATSGTRRAPTT